jgi:hypothetical protein
MKISKIALKPYLDTITGYCDSLSNEELTHLIVTLAKGIPTSGRVNFLEKIKSCLPDGGAARTPDPSPVEQTLNEIEALKESIEERIESIEDGSYWDEPAHWDEDGYYDEEPDYIGEDQADELESIFDDAESLFLNDRLAEARQVYEALFNLIGFVKEKTYSSPEPQTDIREARARYCRCVYETSGADKRLDAFEAAMEIGVFSTHEPDDYDEDYPLMQDVIDARPGKMGNLDSFWPEWKKVLSTSELKGRSAVLLLEAVNRLEGISGVSKLAKKWKNAQPQGYLFWLNLLNEESDHSGIVAVSKEGLKALKRSRFRERVATFLIEAAKESHDPKNLLLGKRERFFSHMDDQKLLDLTDEAFQQKARNQELSKVIKYFKARRSIDEDEKNLFIKTLLMSGKLGDALAMVKREKCVGWSYGSSAGVVFGSALSVLANHSDKASTINALLAGYANNKSNYIKGISINDNMSTSFYGEILEGLKKKKFTKSQTAEYLAWAERIGKRRIDHIVSNQHRGAYARAAQVLGSLAEAYAAMGQKAKAIKILHTYFNEKYKRFHAFRREVKGVVVRSDLLRNVGISL